MEVCISRLMGSFLLSIYLLGAWELIFMLSVVCSMMIINQNGGIASIVFVRSEMISRMLDILILLYISYKSFG